MSQLEFFTDAVKLIWDGLSTITVPFLNIPVTSLFLGMFVATFSIMILRPILGLGAGALSAVNVHRGRSSRRSAGGSQRSSKSFKSWKASDTNWDSDW